MRTILALVALLALGCSDPQAGEPVWYGLPYDSDSGCVVDPDLTYDLFVDPPNVGVPLDECAALGEELIERFGADGYRCARGCRAGVAKSCGAQRADRTLVCDATVDVIVPE